LDKNLVISEVRELVLQPGELLLVPSDGLFDAMNGEFASFGTRRAFDSISQHRDKPARLILESLCRKVHAFAQGATQIDDITAVLLKVDASFNPILGPVPQPDGSLESFPTRPLGFD
jgi:sigma-B regulation protein RsbU (phosphoserine phosphatase)